jgi:hypothetical protein
MYSQIDNRAAKELLGWQPNASLEVFVREAIDCHADPVFPGDLRLPTALPPHVDGCQAQPQTH